MDGDISKPCILENTVIYSDCMVSEKNELTLCNMSSIPLHHYDLSNA